MVFGLSWDSQSLEDDWSGLESEPDLNVGDRTRLRVIIGYKSSSVNSKFFIQVEVKE